MADKKRIGFIGLGKLGMPCAEVMAENHIVCGFDIEQKESNSVVILKTIEAVSKQSDIIFIAVPTPHENGYDGSEPSSHLEPKDFSYQYVKEALIALNPFCDKQKTVVLISTVLPGTIRKQLAPLLSNSDLIYNPYLIAMGTVKWDMKQPEMIIIGSENAESRDKVELLIELYDTIVEQKTRYEVGTWEEAESIKIFYNTFISAKLGLVNMIQDVAERLGNMNVDVVSGALMRSTYRILGPAYMKAGLGDGGPCHPRDNIALRFLAQKLNLHYDLFGAIMESREVQAKNMAARLFQLKLPVVILGKSYKPNVSLTDGSFSMLVGHYITQMGGIVYYDNHPDASGVYTYLIGHEGKYNDFPFTLNSIIVDPWRSFSTNRNDLTIIWYGNTRPNKNQ
jgi:UDPglucose 6-dehydrogenase